MEPGSRLGNGRYAVRGVRGEGAQGTTFDAVDERENRPVAIKRFDVRGARSWKDVELAEREADGETAVGTGAVRSAEDPRSVQRRLQVAN